MKVKDKFLIGLITVCTLGFCWLYWKKQAKKQQAILQGDAELPNYVNLTELVAFLGGNDNITEISHTFSNVKISFLDRAKIDVEAIKNLKYVSGIMLNQQKITLIVGEIAKILAKSLEKLPSLQ
ncbi:hypothetical protein [Mycoplasmopsis iners]|uniref:hypothetical protein n=1 Tax=Mycoplasmopsis iners TaxID=76630 RepID=UPI000495E607|nr:hypothetical protein [Mycoplasmopsis iners]